MNCDICCEKYNKSSRASITCISCNYLSCKTCVMTYLLGSDNDPHCMNCKIGWNQEFISSNTPKNFYNGKLRDHLSKIFLDKEKALLPETQPILEKENKLAKLKNDIAQLTISMNLIKKKIVAKRRKHDDIKYGHNDDTNNIPTVHYMCKCPANDCRGFVNSYSHKCGICDIEVCKDCQTICEEEHKCNENDIETIKLLKQDTRNCPNCQTSIFKIEGCDQMYCTQCHSAFSWKSGKIEIGNIHNPHYFEWLRKNGKGNIDRNPLDIQCGGLPPVTLLPNTPHLNNLYQQTQDIQHRVLPLINRQLANNTNQDLRIKYLRGSITEKSWQSLLKTRFKKKQLNKEISDVMNMWVNTMITLFNNIIFHTNGKQIFKSTSEVIINKFIQEVDSINSLIPYVNEHMEQIRYRYNNKVPMFVTDKNGWVFDM